MLDDPRNSEIYASVFECASEHGLELVETEDVNGADAIAAIRGRHLDAAMSFSARWILRREVLDLFDGRVLNLHASPLPLYRGGGGPSWMIMNGHTRSAIVLHLVDLGVDSGPVVLRAEADVGVPAPYPFDHFKVQRRLARELLERFFEGVRAGARFTLEPLDLTRGTYFPRLRTEVNGVIDWHWPAADIERTIRAFGWPYRGASTWSGDRRLLVARAELRDPGERFHPFMAGLAIGVAADGGVRVVCGDGSLTVVSLRSGAAERPASEVIRIGERLTLPAAAREAAWERARF
jgi:methionyl-tRNA formyltransferase